MAKLGNTYRLLGGLRTLDAVLGTTAATFLNAGGVERSANDMVANARKILHATTTNEHDRVLLKIVTFIRNVRNHFVAVGEANLRNLTDSGVWLLRRTGHDLNAH